MTDRLESGTVLNSPLLSIIDSIVPGDPLDHHQGQTARSLPVQTPCSDHSANGRTREKVCLTALARIAGEDPTLLRKAHWALRRTRVIIEYFLREPRRCLLFRRTSETPPLCALLWMYIHFAISHFHILCLSPPFSPPYKDLSYNSALRPGGYTWNEGSELIYRASDTTKHLSSLHCQVDRQQTALAPIFTLLTQQKSKCPIILSFPILSSVCGTLSRGH